MRESKTLGILLRKTLLGNDDALLEFFTKDLGRVTLGVRKFGRSKKRMAEIDFFRLLEIEIFEGRNNKSLKDATCTQVFHGFEKNWRINKLGFEWLARLREILPEEKTAPNLFRMTHELFAGVKAEDADWLDLYFRVKILSYQGALPSSSKSEEEEILSFLEQNDFQTFEKNKSHLPAAEIPRIQKVLEKMEEVLY
ncbi:DNA repair protein RecO [Candidatus Gracilibacteria bacterium]|nr:DNA repair protein RecO [Candidatus Gracilibacteria bacterium]MCF7819427.1 DNA repair protein RecO [Candidatus Gracilibacteria bacterium]